MFGQTCCTLSARNKSKVLPFKGGNRTREWTPGVRDHRDHFQSPPWSAMILNSPPKFLRNILRGFLWNHCIKKSVAQWMDEHLPHFRRLGKKCLELKLSKLSSMSRSQAEQNRKRHKVCSFCNPVQQGFRAFLTPYGHVCHESLYLAFI